MRCFAITRGKIVVIDPFSDHCVVATGSNNLGYQASHNNDENLVIVEGNKALAQAYASTCWMSTTTLRGAGACKVTRSRRAMPI